MSREETHPADEERDQDSFLERWSRRKHEAREAEASRASDGTPPPDPAAAAAGPAAESPAPELPDVEQLDQDSDYRAFFAPGVDAELRRRALRKLFRGPKFNVLDGLDIYQDDFRSFEPLGGIVTADMRHQIEAAARRIAAGVEKLQNDPSPAAATVAAPVAEQGSPAMPPTEDDADDDQRDS